MKKRSLIYLLLIGQFGLFSTKLFAQEPLDPGNDPMKADSAKHIVLSKPAENERLTSPVKILPSKKNKDVGDKKTETIQLNKNKEDDDSQVVF